MTTTNSYASGTVSGDSNIGGLVGFIGEDATETFTNVYCKQQGTSALPAIGNPEGNPGGTNAIAVSGHTQRNFGSFSFNSSGDDPYSVVKSGDSWSIFS